MAELDWTSRWSHCCRVANCSVLLLVLLAWYGLNSTDGEINFNVDNCREEDPTSWNWINDYRIPVTGNGTRCHAQCSPNCTCTLDGDIVTSNCSHKNISITQFMYPSDVRYLSWEDSVLHHIAPGTFKQFGSLLNGLHLGNINLLHLQGGVFSGLSGLQWLFLNNNALDKLLPGVFKELQDLNELHLEWNLLHGIAPDVFEGLDALYLLELSFNYLQKILPGAFNGLVRLQVLRIDGNELHEILPGTFNELVNLWILYIDSNELAMILTGTFDTFKNLFVLGLSYNKLTILHPDIFQNLTYLEFLGLNDNQLHFLPEDLFQNLNKLKYLDLSSNNLYQIPTLSPIVMLKYVNLKGNPLLGISHNLFTGLNSNVKLVVTRFESCCFASIKCIYDIPPSPFLTCGRLLTYDLLRIVIWFVSILGIVGNISVLFTRCRHMSQSNKVQLLLITNLSISDFIMAIYLLILLSADLYYKDYFPSHSEAWRDSLLCRIAGTLSVLSSEASAFFIVMISIDRYFGIKYPFGGRWRLGTKSTRWVVAILWLVAFGISISTFVLSGTDSNVYSVSEVCVGLPISREESFIVYKRTLIGYWSESKSELKPSGSKMFMYLSTAIFTALNLACFIVVAFCYLALFISARKSTRKSGRSVALANELRMAGKMFLIVFTDFCCWVPIGIVSILVQANVVTVSPTAYAWIATFVLPINSTINPFLYTLSGFLWDKLKCPSSKCQKQQEQREDIEMRVEQRKDRDESDS